MSKELSIGKKQTNVIRLMLKNKEDLHLELRKDTTTENARHFLYDVFFHNLTGTLTFVVKEGEITIASLNLSNNTVYTLQNNANVRKLCNYVLSTVVS